MPARAVCKTSAYTKKRNEETSEKGEPEKQTLNQKFQVQNYRDYNVYSDVENVLNLNPASYIDHVKPLHVEADTKTTDIKESQKRPHATLIADVDKIQPPPVSKFANTTAHIIGPSQPSKQVAPRQRRQRRDDSEKNYYETVALNDEVNSLFGDKKTSDTNSVSKIFLEMCI